VADPLASAERFYSELPEVTHFADLSDPRNFRQAPLDSLLVLTDVRGSTKAIEAGRYRDVNALGVATIIALCNAMRDLELPFVFGGDGSTLLIPQSRREASERALRGVLRVAASAYQLELRAGIVPVRELLEHGGSTRLARFRASPHICLAMFAGNGFAVAEKWLKDPARAERFLIAESGDASADFEGFECRWQPVTSRRGAVVSLLVLATDHDENQRGSVYRRVMDRLNQLATPEQLQPLSKPGLKLKPFADFSTEARLRAGGTQGEAFDAARKHARKKALIGRALMGLGLAAGGFDGSTYKDELIANTDFRKFDETLRMVLDLPESEILALEGYLEAERSLGHLVYGIHRADAALVTCFVRSHSGNHVHFVDGANGGYALAAKQLKQQLKGE